MIPKEFYTAFGNLLYAVAISDGAVQKEEQNAIAKLIKEKLVPLENAKDSMGSDLAYYTLFAFETAEDRIESLEGALQTFVDYIKEHHQQLNTEHIKVMNFILREVAKSHGRVTKKEKEIIDVFNAMIYNF